MATMRASALACLVAVVRGAPTDVKVVGKQLLVNGEPFHAKGVCWNPVPFNGTHPVDQDFPGFVEQDGDLMEAAGINAVRVYDPISDMEVLDKLYARGIYVVMNVYIFWDVSPDTLEQAVAKRVNAVKDHPAILFWEIGNEWNYNCLYKDGTNCMGSKGQPDGDYEQALNLMIRAAAEIKRNDLTHPVATNYGELPDADTLSKLNNVDMWGLNAYRGKDFGTFFEDFRARSDLPMYIGEYGADAWDVNRYPDIQPKGSCNLTAQADATRELTLQINRESSIYGGAVTGQFIFSLADEWWKDPNGKPDEHEISDGAPGQGPWPDQKFNEEWWGIVDIWRVPRPAYHVYADIPNPFQGNRLGCEATPSPPGTPAPTAPPAPSPGRDPNADDPVADAPWLNVPNLLVGIFLGLAMAGTFTLTTRIDANTGRVVEIS